MKKTTGLLNIHLSSFMAVAKHKSIHATARAIHISQTALTQRIQLLEDKLGITLFIRTQQGMQLTGEGETLLRYCHAVNDFSNETLSNIMQAGITTPTRVKISGPTSVMITRVIPQCIKIMKAFPSLYITFDIDDTNEIVTSLRTGASQFAILLPQQITGDMTVKQLRPDKYQLLCSAKWKTRSLKDILSTERIIDFNETDQMTFNYLKHYDLFKYAQSERLFVNRNESLLCMLQSGLGYGVLTKDFSKDLLKKKALMLLNEGKAYENDLSLAWYARPEPPAYFSTLIKTLG